MDDLYPSKSEQEGLIISEMFSKLRKDEVYPNARFKVGDIVKYIGSKFTQHTNKIFVVGGVGESDDFEYSLKGFPYLVWESEIEPGFYTCKYCGTSNETINNCKKCGAPQNIKENC